ncbi:MAG: efflux RND transporter periplasmic adaptor subunit [Betaproteobacteria bacterium]|nr:MAG: efflux RND transporter periplasmic adaptor subunit [Betaproteobacteria bacterium]
MRRVSVFVSALVRAAAVWSALIFLTAPALASEFDCLIEARQTVEVRSSVEAVIEKIHVRRGDYVRKGQVLVNLESGAERAALELARSRATMQGEIKAAEARLELASKKRQQAQELYEQKFVSATARDEAVAEYKLATEQLRQARENKLLAQLEVKRTSEILALRTIRSPLTGLVVETVLSPGEFATSNLKDPILRLVEINPLNVEVILPVSEFGRIKAGTEAIVLPEEPIGGEYSATVKIVDRIVDAASGTFGVRLELPNRRGSIPPGVRCRVRFP